MSPAATSFAQPQQSDRDQSRNINDGSGEERALIEYLIQNSSENQTQNTGEASNAAGETLYGALIPIFRSPGMDRKDGHMTQFPEARSTAVP